MQVQSCCGCYSLRAGTIIIGMLQIILLIIMLILTFALNINWQMSLIHVNPVTGKTIYSTAFCIVIFIDILLLVGVFKRNTVCMFPWLVLGVIGALAGVVNVIGGSTILFVNHIATRGVAFLIGGLIGLVIYIYLWLVVYSHFQQLRYDKNSRIGPQRRPRNNQEV